LGVKTTGRLFVLLMINSVRQFLTPSFSKNILIIVGGYGSGKSEVAVNLARYLATNQQESVTIADLDIVNPYFRSREVEEELETFAVKSISPRGGYRYADIPIILPEIKGAIEQHKGKLILDVGGDDTGARILSSFAGSFEPSGYELLFVLNANRPFTEDVESCLKLMGEIEAASRLKFTGLISNTHLLEDTTAETVLHGFKLAKDVQKRTGLPVVLLSASEDILKEIAPASLDVPVLMLSRLLLKPWERKKDRQQGS